MFAAVVRGELEAALKGRGGWARLSGGKSEGEGLPELRLDARSAPGGPKQGCLGSQSSCQCAARASSTAREGPPCGSHPGQGS